MRERYETFINKKKYVFVARFGGHNWTANAFDADSFKLVASAESCSAENVLLLLVKLLEKVTE